MQIQTVIKIAHYIILAGLIFIGSLLFLSFMPLSTDFDLRIVQSGSMEPEIKTGSMIFIRSADEYKVGDVITFKPEIEDRTPITHRIIDKDVVNDEDVFITKGDANRTSDMQPINEKEIMGKMIFSVPYIGHILNFAQNPFGFFILILLPFIVISIEEIGKILQVTKSNSKKNI
ncbi:MAG: signal peptidase I [Candidatus Paceibacterota bacterium]